VLQLAHAVTAPPLLESGPSVAQRRSGVGSPGAVQEAAWRQYLAGCAIGDERAFAALYDQSSRLVYSLALRVVGNPAAAEEVTLDVYTQVWKRAGSFDGSRGGVGAWLTMLARSRAIDRLRSSQACQRREATTPLQGRPVDDGERRRRLLGALACLSSDQRELLEMAFFQGLTHSDLAERLNRPLDTVKTTIRTAMIALREHLEPPVDAKARRSL
jgi:RNA polymerase sigma-70 factor (ECF subfamily)